MGTLSAEHLLLLLMVLALSLLAYSALYGAIQKTSDKILASTSNSLGGGEQYSSPADSALGFFSRLIQGVGDGLADIFSNGAQLADPNFCMASRHCSSGRVCSPSLHSCVYPSKCVLLSGTNQTGGKIDLLFIGDGFSDDEKLASAAREVLNGGQGGGGLFSFEPFSNHSSLFNVRAIRASELLPSVRRSADFYDFDSGPVDAAAAQCSESDYSFVLSTQRFRSYTSGHTAFISLSYDPRAHWGRLVSHEFGHAFASLKDEYVEPSLGDRSGFPNCANGNLTARQWWGGISGAGFFAGCSYVDSNVRPTENSIMRDHRIAGADYGPVNSHYMEQRLEQWENQK